MGVVSEAGIVCWLALKEKQTKNASRFGLLYVHTCTGRGRSGPYIETGIETGIETAAKTYRP